MLLTPNAFLEALNNWYIRRSRPRFWRAERDTDKQAAYDTLFTALDTLCRVASPLLPMLSEEIFTGLGGTKSVHLQDWPSDIAEAADPAVEPARALGGEHVAEDVAHPGVFGIAREPRALELRSDELQWIREDLPGEAARRPHQQQLPPLRHAVRVLLQPRLLQCPVPGEQYVRYDE